MNVPPTIALSSDCIVILVTVVLNPVPTLKVVSIVPLLFNLTILLLEIKL